MELSIEAYQPLERAWIARLPKPCEGGWEWIRGLQRTQQADPYLGTKHRGKRHRELTRLVPLGDASAVDIDILLRTRVAVPDKDKKAERANWEKWRTIERDVPMALVMLPGTDLSDRRCEGPTKKPRRADPRLFNSRPHRVRYKGGPTWPDARERNRRRAEELLSSGRRLTREERREVQETLYILLPGAEQQRAAEILGIDADTLRRIEQTEEAAEKYERWEQLQREFERRDANIEDFSDHPDYIPKPPKPHVLQEETLRKVWDALPRLEAEQSLTSEDEEEEREEPYEFWWERGKFEFINERERLRVRGDMRRVMDLIYRERMVYPGTSTNGQLKFEGVLKDSASRYSGAFWGFRDNIQDGFEKLWKRMGVAPPGIKDGRYKHKPLQAALIYKISGVSAYKDGDTIKPAINYTQNKSGEWVRCDPWEEAYFRLDTEATIAELKRWIANRGDTKNERAAAIREGKLTVSLDRFQQVKERQQLKAEEDGIFLNPKRRLEGAGPDVFDKLDRTGV